MNNWKTTLCGLGMILSALGDAAMAFAGENRLNVAEQVALIMGGVGLVLAKDARPRDNDPDNHR
jgi:hypothetical protein